MANPFLPVVFYRDPMAALRWLERAFGFELSMLVTDEAGNVGHAEMSFGEGRIGVGGEWSSPELLGPASLKSPASTGGVSAQFIRVFLDEGLDEHCARAEAAGARITQTPADQFYGDRTYRALDPEGHVWNFAERTAELSLEDMEKAGGVRIRSDLD